MDGEIPKYKRILLKLSGEILAGDKKFGIDNERLEYISEELKSIYNIGVQVAVVVGGGNIIRGSKIDNKTTDRVVADYMGMLGTIINGLALQGVLEKHNINTRLLTAIRVEQLAEPYIRRRAIRHMEKGRIVILAGGTGNPFFSTDTAATLRAVEIGADIFLKGTKVDGVYEKDPLKFPDTKLYHNISLKDMLNMELGIMDLTAMSLALQTQLSMIVFNILVKGNLKKVIMGKEIGTRVGKESSLNVD